MTTGWILGVIVGFLGVAVMIGNEALGSLGVGVLAQLACLAAALSYAFAGVFGLRFRDMGISPLGTATGQLVASSIVLFPVMLIVDRPWTLAVPSLSVIGALIGLAGLSTALAYIFYFRILASAGATNLLLVTFLIPVSAIEPQIHRAEVERIRHKRPENFDAYDLTLCGLAKMNRLTPKDSADALDPNYARAYACASYCHRRHVQLKGLVISDADKVEAIRLAQAAFKADRTDPYVLWQTGMAIGLLEGDLDEAAALIDRSLSINANANRAWLASATIRCSLGDPGTAIEHAERAMRLSPLDVSMWVAHGVIAVAHMQLKNYQEASSWGRKAIRLHRDNIPPPHHVLVSSLAQMGRQEEAEAALEELLDLNPGLTIGRLKERFPIAGYRNLDGLLEGLKSAGLKA